MKPTILLALYLIFPVASCLLDLETKGTPPEVAALKCIRTTDVKNIIVKSK